MDDYKVKKTSVPHKLESSEAWSHGTDAVQPCPSCYSNNQTRMGQIVVDGSPRPAYKCNGCNKMYSDLPAPVKVLADVAINHGASSVGFIAEPSSNADAVNLGYVNDSYNNPLEVQGISNVQQELQQIKHAAQSTANAIQGLIYEIQRLATQNTELMNKMATDPLIHLRKTISEFDLK